MIAIIDYGLGNLASVHNAFARVGAHAERTADHGAILAADGIILPGVGAASAGMNRLRERGLDEVVKQVVAGGVPVLGLCLGMQLLFDWSEEGDTTCLGVLPGTVRRMQLDLKVPHIGWNRVETKGSGGLWSNAPLHPYYYFVHSYVCVPERAEHIAGTTEYGEPFTSAVSAGSVWGVQFHPERSGGTGLQLIRSFAEHCSAAEQQRAS